jgi:hypothetical protein
MRKTLPCYNRLRRRSQAQRLDEVVLDGVAGGTTVGCGLHLAIDCCQMGIDRTGTDHELFGYLCIRKSSCQEIR